MALQYDELLPISAENQNQPCEEFGIHPSLPIIQNFYLQNDLIFLANTGILPTTVTKGNYEVTRKMLQLYAHNIMQREAKRVNAGNPHADTGVLGRMVDVLSRNSQRSVQSFSIAGNDVSTVGKNVQSLNLGPLGYSKMYNNEIQDIILKLNNETIVDSGLYGEAWSENLIQSFGTNQHMQEILETVKGKLEDFPDTSLGKQLKMVSKLIATRKERGVDTDVFYVEFGKFDTHKDVLETLSGEFTVANDAITQFSKALKAMGLWDNVTTVEVSDFARTLTPNSGNGTDHGWGGNYLMFGGAVKGGKILGEYPDDLTIHGSQNVGRGRLIPSTPWESFYQGIAEWLGIPSQNMDEVIPNRNIFHKDLLFTAKDMFVNYD